MWVKQPRGFINPLGGRLWIWIGSICWPHFRNRAAVPKKKSPQDLSWSFIIALSHIVIVLWLNYAWLTWIITYIGMVSQTSHHGDVVARCSWLPENLLLGIPPRPRNPKPKKSQKCNPTKMWWSHCPCLQNLPFSLLTNSHPARNQGLLQLALELDACPQMSLVTLPKHGIIQRYPGHRITNQPFNGLL